MFADHGNGNMDVIQDFDFDAFLFQDSEGDETFHFDSAAFLDRNDASPRSSDNEARQKT